MISEVFRMAVSSLAAHRLRTVLSLVGIVIGIASVVAVTSISESGTANIRGHFEKLGMDTVTIFPQFTETGPKVLLTNALLGDLARWSPAVKRVLRLTSLPGSAVRGKNQVAGTIQAVESPFFSSQGLEFARGRAFTGAEEYGRRAVAVLGDEAARSLFPNADPLGQDLQLNLGQGSVSVVVTGVLAPRDGGMNGDLNRSVLVSYRYVEGNLVGDLPVQEVVVVAAGRDKVLALTDDLKRFFTERTGQPDAVFVSSVQEWAKGDVEVANASNLILVGVAAISLLVGGVGIMNIMLVSVAERRKEIGIRKALGADPAAIRFQFLLEAGLLTFAGGVVGLAAGWSVAWSVAAASGWTWAPSPGIAVTAVVVSAATGVFFGLYPASRAAALDPVAALAAE